MHQRLFLVRSCQNAKTQVRSERRKFLPATFQSGAENQRENDARWQHAGRVSAAEKTAKFFPHGGDKRSRR